jgi:hypothetical protein
MIDQAEWLRELEDENEDLKDTIGALHRVEKDNAVLRLAIDNIETILGARRPSFRTIKAELVAARIKLQVLEESE